MADKHKSRLVADYQRLLEHKPIHVLDIPDEYRYMDAAPIAQLRLTVGPIIEQLISQR